MAVVTRTYSSDLTQLAEMRAFLDAVCREAWSVEPDHDTLCELELAVHEAAANIMRHSYEGEAGKPVVMTVDINATRAVVDLRHEGSAFSPEGVPPPRFDGSQFGGFGVYLIKQLVDEVHYDLDAEGRSGIRLVKLFRKERPADNECKTAPEVDKHATLG